MPIDPALLATSIEALGDLDPEPDLPASPQRAVTAAKQLLGADAAGITLTDATGALHWASGSDQPAQAVANDREACAAGPCTEAFATGRPAVMYDAYQERRRGGPWGEVSLAIAELEPRSALSVPIDLGDGPIGTLDLYATSPRGGITPRSAPCRTTPGWWRACSARRPRPTSAAFWPTRSRLPWPPGCRSGRLGRADGRATPERLGGVHPTLRGGRIVGADCRDRGLTTAAGVPGATPGIVATWIARKAGGAGQRCQGRSRRGETSWPSVECRRSRLRSQPAEGTVAPSLEGHHLGHNRCGRCLAGSLLPLGTADGATRFRWRSGRGRRRPAPVRRRGGCGGQRLLALVGVGRRRGGCAGRALVRARSAPGRLGPGRAAVLGPARSGRPPAPARPPGPRLSRPHPSVVNRQGRDLLPLGVLDHLLGQLDHLARRLRPLPELLERRIRAHPSGGGQHPWPARSRPDWPAPAAAGPPRPHGWPARPRC